MWAGIWRPPESGGAVGHLGNLGLRDSAQACKQLQVLAASQQLEDGVRLRAVAHTAVRGSCVLGHAEDGAQALLGDWLSPGHAGTNAAVPGPTLGATLVRGGVSQGPAPPRPEPPHL